MPCICHNILTSNSRYLYCHADATWSFRCKCGHFKTLRGPGVVPVNNFICSWCNLSNSMPKSIDTCQSTDNILIDCYGNEPLPYDSDDE